MPVFEPLPDPDHVEVRLAREHAGLSQRAASALIGFSRQATWADYEAGRKIMPGALWTLFLLATDQHPQAMVVRRPDGESVGTPGV